MDSKAMISFYLTLYYADHYSHSLLQLTVHEIIFIANFTPVNFHFKKNINICF